VGFLWTPGYWAFSAGLYNWYPGYWGPTVGFYGGINYGFGYTGVGYWGGYWRGHDFYYNRAVNNVNITNIHNVYNRTVVNNSNGNRVSYNGGPGGVQARPTSEQMATAREERIGATSAQARNEQAARSDRSQFAAANHGQQTMNRQTPNANTANNGREVPRPPQSNQQARASVNVPRPPQNSYTQQRAAANVPRPSNYQQQARAYGNVPRPGNYTRQAASQARSVQRPAAMQRSAAPQYRAPSQHQATAYRSAPSGGGQGGRRH
jgi:hypothetical protein